MDDTIVGASPRRDSDQAGSDPALHGSDPIEAKANRAEGGAPTGLDT